MAMEFREMLVVFSDTVCIEDTEPLLAWLQDNPTAGVDFSNCTQVHPANLQVLMAAGTRVVVWPADTALAQWLQSAFPT